MRRFWRSCFTAGIFALFFVGAHQASAATLRLSPASGSVQVGSTISVSVILSSADQAANAVSGVIMYPSDQLQMTSLSKSGSVVGLWVQEPSYANDAGSAHFEGVILNPGYIGSGATVITAKFKAKKEGTASVTFSSPQVLANDGSGTDILTGSSGSTIVISAAAEKPAESSPLPTAPAKKPPAPTQDAEPALLELEAPGIAVNSSTIPFGGELRVSGTSKYPGATVRLRMGTQASDADFNEEVSGARHMASLTAEDGSFLFVIPSDGLHGNKMLTARIEDSDGNTSPQSHSLSINFEGRPWWPIVAGWFTNIGLGFIATLLLILILCMCVFEVVRYRALRRIIHTELHGTVDTGLYKTLFAMRGDIEDLVTALEKEKTKRKLTTIESRFVRQMKEYLADTDSAVQKGRASGKRASRSIVD